MVFGASSGRHPASVQLVDALLDFGARITPLPASVELAQNGQQFSTDAVAFTYYPAPVVSSILPSHGPTAGHSGVVISGAHLPRGSHYVCKFGDAETPATYVAHSSQVACRTPHHRPSGASNVRVSLNGQQFTTSSVSYLFHELPTVSRAVSYTHLTLPTKRIV